MTSQTPMTREHVMVLERQARGLDRTAAVFPDGHPAKVAMDRDAAVVRQAASFLGVLLDAEVAAHLERQIGDTDDAG